MANIKRANASGITKPGAAISDVPDTPTIGTATDAGTGSSVSVTFTAAATGGAATSYTVTSNPGGLTGTGASSPITVTGLTPDTSYTFTVTATNSTGTSAASSASNSVAPASIIPGAYTSLSTVTVGAGGAATITFTGIPAGYKDLQIRLSSCGSTTADAYIRFNGDSGANYSCHQTRGGGSTAQSYSYTTQNQMVITSNIGQSSTSPNVAICDILDYTSTSKNKTIRSLTGYDLNGSGEMIFWSGLWYATPAAITSITLSMSTGTFRQDSTFALYGVK